MTEQKETKLRISVGYALPPKKIETLILPSLITNANHKNIDLIPVDLNKPLFQQGPFDCLIHKLYDDDWNHQLLSFKAKFPKTLIIDSPSSIQRLQNRISMLEVVNSINIPSLFESDTLSFGIPNQIVLRNDDEEDEDLSPKFPLIAKPLMADGSSNSHQLSLVFNSNGLQKVKQQHIPVVLQEFVNHGGILFKVYVAGNQVKCVERKSLPDFHVSEHPFLKLEEGILPFSQISNLPAAVTDSGRKQDIRMPPLEFIQNLAAALRNATQLHLFNFDLIQDGNQPDGNNYLIIDINYFPGYAKLPGFEAMFTDFLWDAVNHHIATENT